MQQSKLFRVFARTPSLSIPACLVFAIAVLTVVGWCLKLDALLTLGVAGAPMVMNTAICFVLSSAGLFAVAAKAQRISRGCAVIVALFSLTVLAQHFSARDIGIDRLFWHHPQVTPFTIPGRMAPLTACAFLHIAVLLHLLSGRKQNWWLLATFVGGLLLASLLPLISYLIVLSPNNSWGSYRGVAFATASSFFILATAILWWISQNKPTQGPTLALLVAAVATVVAIGNASLKGNADLLEANALLCHTFEVNGRLDRFTTVMSKMDLAVCRYVATGDETLRQEAAQHRSEALRELESLSLLTQDNLSQTSRLRAFRPLLDADFRANDEMVEAVSAKGALVSEVFTLAPSRSLNEEIARKIADLREEENLLLARRTSATVVTARNLWRTQFLGGVGVLILVGLAFNLAHRASVARNQAQSQLAVARDEALEGSRLKSQFLANMSHEIRTPMNGVIGMTSLLLETPMSTEQREYLEIIRGSGETLLVLISDILDFSKIESGKIELEQQEFNLVTCIEEILLLFKAKAQEKHIELMYSVEPDVPQAVVGDVTRMRQIVSNLVSNALKFTAKGEVEVAVAVGNASSEFTRNITVSVRDTGIGIPEDKRHRLFQPFTQIDASTSRRFGGTGLGLTISKRLCELMGGTLEVESTEGKGSIFRVMVKFGVVTLHRTLSATPWPTQAGQRKVLVVDDNATNRRILRLYLRGWGIECSEATNASEAVRFVSQEHFDACLMDMYMPDCDGLSLSAKLRGLNPDAPVPVIILTSGGRDEISRRAGEYGVAAVLDKPVRQAALYKSLLEVFGHGIRIVDTSPPQTRNAQDIAHDRPYSILLADDNSVNQLVAQRMLQKLGYRADNAADGLEVLAALERQIYDVVFMDVQMPEMDGIEATQHLRKSSKGVQPWIIAMTANAMTGDRERCLEAGMNDYISKPVKIQEIRDALLRVEPRKTVIL